MELYGEPFGGSRVWGLIAGGFVFLAVDEALQIHERLDFVIHKALNIRETALTDRLDDAIIATMLFSVWAPYGISDGNCYFSSQMANY